MARAISTALRWIVSLLVPLSLLGLGVRALLTPGYMHFEYRLPDFPADPYGFSTEDRLHFGSYGIRYLINNSSIAYLADLVSARGAPLFAEDELSHMEDVKVVVRQLLLVWYVGLALLGMIALGAWRTGHLTDLRRGLRHGGLLTLGIGAICGMVATVGSTGSGDLFWDFFSGFHGLFFQADSWLFSYSDTLIRLYPLRFWQDSLLYIAVLTALGALALVVVFREQPAART
jgi:integral membrane protein (TIGR01906 family)